MKNIKFKKIKIKNNEEKEYYADIFSSIAASVNQDPGKHVYGWMDNSDCFVLAENDQKNIIGFAGYRFFKDNVVYVSAIMIKKEYQSKGIASVIMKRVITAYFIHKIIRFKNIFSGINVLFRTQNPSLYARFYKKVKTHPELNREEAPPDHIKNIAKKYAAHLWPDSVLDEKTFILKGAYEKNPSLALDPGDVTWSGNAAVDEFFNARLGLDRGSTDALLVISEVRLSSLIKS